MHFFCNGSPTAGIYTLSLHDALPISWVMLVLNLPFKALMFLTLMNRSRSEERFSRNAETDLVCRLLLEKKNNVWRGESAVCGSFFFRRVFDETSSSRRANRIYSPRPR